MITRPGTMKCLRTASVAILLAAVLTGAADRAYGQKPDRTSIVDLLDPSSSSERKKEQPADPSRSGPIDPIAVEQDASSSGEGKSLLDALIEQSGSTPAETDALLSRESVGGARSGGIFRAPTAGITADPNYNPFQAGTSWNGVIQLGNSSGSHSWYDYTTLEIRVEKVRRSDAGLEIEHEVEGVVEFLSKGTRPFEPWGALARFKGHVGQEVQVIPGEVQQPFQIDLTEILFVPEGTELKSFTYTGTWLNRRRVSMRGCFQGKEGEKLDASLLLTSSETDVSEMSAGFEMAGWHLIKTPTGPKQLTTGTTWVGTWEAGSKMQVKLQVLKSVLSGHFSGTIEFLDVTDRYDVTTKFGARLRILGQEKEGTVNARTRKNLFTPPGGDQFEVHFDGATKDGQLLGTLTWIGGARTDGQHRTTHGRIQLRPVEETEAQPDASPFSLAEMLTVGNTLSGFVDQTDGGLYVARLSVVHTEGSQRRCVLHLDQFAPYVPYRPGDTEYMPIQPWRSCATAGIVAAEFDVIAEIEADDKVTMTVVGVLKGSHNGSRIRIGRENVGSVYRGTLRRGLILGTVHRDKDAPAGPFTFRFEMPS